MAELSLSEIWIPLAAALGLALVLLLLSWLIFRDIKKAGIIVSISLILFFSYGLALDVITGWGEGIIHIGGFVVGTPARYLLLGWAMIFICGLYLIRRTRRNLHNLTNIVNVVAATLVAVSSISIVAYELTRPSLAPVDKTAGIAIDAEQIDTLPDIYYIILDAYGSSSTFEEYYNFDNSEFTDWLSDRGFYVATESAANHSGTHLSLASSLNMEYLHHLRDEVGEKKASRLAYEMIGDSEVWQLLRSLGYKYVHVGSSWSLTATNINADVTFSPLPISPFSWILSRSTMLRIVPVISEKLGIANPRLRHWKSALYQFERLAEVPDIKEHIKEPIFVFAHVVIPHVPHVFARDGTFVTNEEEADRTPSENYINQLVACNELTKTAVDEILSKYSLSEVSPVIILQGDHGPWRGAFPNGGSLSDDDIYRIHQRVLNAYHLPKGGNELLYPSITPVNTFRLIFDYYFGTNYGLLPDRNYRGISTFDVSDILKE
ncbi:hypothetical protein KAR91_15825 [Candidatus Pacearchaeota archaeon]|nr:hypothetical protein [Candidatus Pacearchaeota archaeon]